MTAVNPRNVAHVDDVAPALGSTHRRRVQSPVSPPAVGQFLLRVGIRRFEGLGRASSRRLVSLFHHHSSASSRSSRRKEFIRLGHGLGAHGHVSSGHGVQMMRNHAAVLGPRDGRRGRRGRGRHLVRRDGEENRRGDFRRRVVVVIVDYPASSHPRSLSSAWICWT